MNDILKSAILSIRNSKATFWKFVSPNDAGETGGHQAGLYMPKDAISFMFEDAGIRGENKEKFVDIFWYNGAVSQARFIYYGQGTRNEYRITRLGIKLVPNQIILLCKEGDKEYKGYLINENNDKNLFLELLNLSVLDSNSVLADEKIDSIDFDKILKTIEISDGIKSEQLFFKPKAHILTLLGEELIKSPVMAIYELVKNSYDADAKNVSVEFHQIEDTDNSKITIVDNGTGISEEVLENVWLEPGSAHRKPVNSDGKRVIVRSPIFNRVPMGEKGVGRFAVHKLGRKILIISRPCVLVEQRDKSLKKELLPYEIYLEIDWNSFTQSKYLEDVKIYWTKKIDSNKFYFKHESGTLIEVSDLKERWTRGMARQLKRHTLSMVSPKNDKEKFHIDLVFENNWLNDIPDINEVLSLAPYKMTAFLNEKFELSFEYEFSLSNNSQMGTRSIVNDSAYDKSVRGDLRPYFRSFLVDKGYEKEDLENQLDKFGDSVLPFGKIMLEFYSYDLDSNSLKDTSYTPEIIRSILRDHHGVKVYKDELRVFNYGEQGDDWLGLDLKRVNNKEWFSNNQNIGFVYLDSASSSTLVEKTNREGFIDNESLELFKICLDFLLNLFRAERQKDRVKWLALNSVDRKGSFNEKVSRFIEMIDKSEIPDPTKKQLLLEEATKIEEEYEKTKETLLLPAGVGLTASVALHEIEKLVPKMQSAVQVQPIPANELKNFVSELNDYVNGILTILRKSQLRPVDLREVLPNALNHYKAKAKIRKIDISYLIDDDVPLIICDKRYLATMIMNLVENSIHWLDTVHRENKVILVKASVFEEVTHLIVVDNGPGFRDSAEDLVRPFFSRREDGIGIGLYIIDTLMMKYGKLLFNEVDIEFDRIKYSGAAVSLIFNKNQN